MAACFLGNQRKGKELIQDGLVALEFVTDQHFHRFRIIRKEMVLQGDDADLGGNDVVGQFDNLGQSQSQGLGFITDIEINRGDDAYAVLGQGQHQALVVGF